MRLKSRTGTAILAGAGALMILCSAAQFYRRVHGQSAKAGLTVKAIAHEWWWEFDYPKLGVKSRNELRVPASHLLRLELASADVRHSFWVQGMSEPVDIPPGQVRQLEFTVKSPGELYGNCDSGCGCGKVCMRFRVLVQAPAEFSRWIFAQRNKPMILAAKEPATAPPCALNGKMPSHQRSSAAGDRLNALLRN